MATTYVYGTHKNTGTNVIGNNAKTSYNKLTGYTKIDNRPSSVSSEAYALQIRGFQRDTSGNFVGVDAVVDLKTTGTSSMRCVQGVATVAAGITGSASTLKGIYGQARVDGTLDGASWMAGVYGLIEEGGGSITASHVSAGWFDTHVTGAITGSYQLLYLTENGSTPLDQVMYVYAPGALVFAEFDTCNEFIGNGAKSGGTAKTIKISVDGVDHWINAYPS